MESLMADFADVTIVDLDVDRTEPSGKAAGLRHMHLRLSGEPPEEWVESFNNSRRFPRHGMWRHAWIEGAHIVVDCVPDEIEQYHLADLKQDVAVANKEYREHLQKAARAEEHDQREAANERKRLEELRKRLSF